MNSLLRSASLSEIASLWRLDLLSGDDVAAVCMLWLEQNLDHGDPQIAALAGEVGLDRAEIALIFERILESQVGYRIERDEAMLRALRLHLAASLIEDNLIEGVQLTIRRFASLSAKRLVRNPRRAEEDPKAIYAAENLGLEYVYGGFDAFDDIRHLGPKERLVAAHELTRDLRQSVQELRDCLTAMLADGARVMTA